VVTEQQEEEEEEERNVELRVCSESYFAFNRLIVSDLTALAMPTY
jgi:hypothetical protein